MVKKTLLLLLFGYVIVLVSIFFLQRSLVFSPDNSSISIPHDDIEEVILRTENDEPLYNWHTIASDSNIVILFMHGNSGNISTRNSKLQKLKSLGFDVFLLGYPGYGDSGGSPSEKSFLHAAKQGYSYLISSGYSNNKIVLYGESLGTAVAIQLATTVDARSMILEAPMASVQEMAAQKYPFLPLKWLLRDPFLSISHIEKVDEPILIIHGDMDEAISINNGQRLFDSAISKKFFHIVKGGGHNNLFDYNIEKVIESFINKNQI